jgi:hypothetical protein
MLLYFYLCLSVMLDYLSCSFTSICFLTNLLTIREHRDSPPVFGVFRAAHLLSFLCCIICLACLRPVSLVFSIVYLLLIINSVFSCINIVFLVVFVIVKVIKIHTLITDRITCRTI